MKRVKFTLGLVLSFLLMGAGVSVHATDYIIIGAGSGLHGSVNVTGASGTQTVINAVPTDPDTICIEDAVSGDIVPITSVTISATLTQLEVDTILKPFKEGAKDLETLDMANNTNVKTLDLSGFTSLTTLNNISGCTALETLNVSNSGITALASGSFIPASVKSLDITNCKDLTSLDVRACATLLASKSLTISGCPKLATITSTSDLENLTIIDGCPLNETSCNLPGLKKLDINVSDEAENKVQTITPSSGLASITTLKASGAITELNCSGNNIESLDVTGCSSLSKLNCSGNKLTSLDLTGTNVYVVDENGAENNFAQQVGSDIIVTANPDDPYAGTVAPASLGTVTVVRDENYIFNIDWEIVDVDNNIVLSSKGNEKDGLAIEVQGKSVKGTDITFSIRSNYTYTIKDISVICFGYAGVVSGGFHADGYTGPYSYVKPDGTLGEYGSFYYGQDGSDKTGGEYKFKMPAGNVKIILQVNNSSSQGSPVEPDPIVQRTVEIKADGLKTVPDATAGFHYVAGHKDFTFTVYSKNEITVTTSRNDKVGDGILISKNADGDSWNVTIRRISTNIVITVTEATTESGETGNAAIAKDAVWAANGTLYVKSSAAGIMSVYNVTGQLCKQVPVSGDASFTLPRGIYIVQLNGKAYKVVL